MTKENPELSARMKQYLDRRIISVVGTIVPIASE